MKAVLFIKPRKGKPHRAADLSALGFTPAFTPSGLCFALQVFPRKVDAVVRMHDIAKQHGFPHRQNAPLIWINDDIRIELHSGKKAADLINLYQWLLPAAHPAEQPLNTNNFTGETALP